MTQAPPRSLLFACAQQNCLHCPVIHARIPKMPVTMPSYSDTGPNGAFATRPALHFMLALQQIQCTQVARDVAPFTQVNNTRTL